MAMAAASPAGGLLATREEMQNLMDPAVALSELQSGIVELQEQLLAVQQHSEEVERAEAQQGESAAQGGAAQQARDEKWGGGRTLRKVSPQNPEPGWDGGRTSTGVVASMLLARPPPKAKILRREDGLPTGKGGPTESAEMDRLVAKLRNEIGHIEQKLLGRIERADSAIDRLPDASRRSEPEAPVAVQEEGDGADSDDIEAEDELADHSGVSSASHGEQDELDASGTSTASGSRLKARLRAAAAMDTQAKKVAKEDVKRTLWVGGIPYEWTHLPYNASDTLPHEDGTTDK